MRARGRSRLQELGESEVDLAAAGVSFEALGYIQRPHELLPHEITHLKARGKVLARRYGW
jgi:hypothetical protein